MLRAQRDALAVHAIAAGGAMPSEPVLETQPAIHATALAAAPALDALARRFTVGGVVSRTMSAWWRYAVVFSVLSLVTNAPVAAWFWVLFRIVIRNMVAGRPPSEQDAMAVGLTFPIAWALLVVLSVVQFGAVTSATFRHLDGGRASVGEMLRVGLRRGLPVVATGFLVSLGAGAGALLLVVPGVLFALAASVALPAAVVERPGVVGAIRRSFALTRDHRWALLGAILALLCLAMVFSTLLQVFLSVAAPLARGSSEAGALFFAASQLGAGLFAVIPVVGIAVAYHDLRVEKEGVDTAELARVFD